MIDFPVSDGKTILVGRGNIEEAASAPFLDLFHLGGNEKGVSRKHAEIRVEHKTAFLIDLASTNGTFLNGRRLQPDYKHPLCDGDVIRFGALETRIRLA